MKLPIIPLMLLCFHLILPVTARNQTDEELKQKLEKVMPKDEDFRFTAPQNWSAELLQHTEIVGISSGEKMDEIRRLLDRKPWTTWKSRTYSPSPELIFDLGQPQAFNRLVIFNRHSDALGTAWGNDALKEIEIRVADSKNEDRYRSLGTFSLTGPMGTCIKKGSGQICFFVDNTEPNIVKLPMTRARFVKFIFKTAFWADNMPDKYRNSISLSELMLFREPSAGEPQD